MGHDEIYRHLFESANNAVVTIDREMRFHLLNPAAAAALGGQPSDIAGQLVSDYFPPEISPRHIANIQKVFDTNQPLVDEDATVIRGETKWYQTSLRPIMSSDGEPQLVLVEAADVTDRVKAFLELKKERDFSSCILDTANSLVVCLDREGRILLFNRECERVTGYRRDDVIGQNWHTLFLNHLDPEDQGAFLMQTLLTRSQERMEQEIVIGNGERRTILWCYSSLTCESESDVALIAVGVDITENKRVERELRRQALTFANIYEAVVVTSVDGKITDWSPGAERIFGYSRDDVLGKHPSMLHEEAEAERLAREIPDVVRREGRWRGEFEFLRKDGTKGLADVTVVPLCDEDGKVYATVAINRDITQERALAQQLKEAEARNRAVLEAMPDMVFVLDRDGVFLDFSGSTAEEPIVPPSEFIGRRVDEVVPGWVGEKSIRLARLAIETGEPQELEYELEEEFGGGFFESRIVKCAENTCVAIVRNITHRREMERHLEQVNRRLIEEHKALERKNITLGEVLTQIEERVQNVRQEVLVNTEKVIGPLILRLKDHATPQQLRLIDEIETALGEIASPFGRNLSGTLAHLTLTEIRVAKLIKNGYQTKEIAEQLGISLRTAEKYRQSLRRKLKIVHSHKNLAACLTALSDDDYVDDLRSKG